MAEKGSDMIEVTIQKRDKKGNTKSVKRMVYPKLYGTDRKRALQEEALERKAERDKRSAKQQLAVLDARLGKGLGAKKEREQLAKQVAKDNEKKPKPKAEKAKKAKKTKKIKK